MFPGQMRFADLYDDGRYIIIFDDEGPGTTGTFLVIYKTKEYTPSETVTLESGQYAYDINLHIETGDGGQPPDEPVDPTNIQPKANAGGPYYETVGDTIYFDASDSYDSDGSITKYEWDFGDDTTATGASTIHTYNEINTYRIQLTVTDNKGKTDIDLTQVYITETPNNPPSKPITTGPVSGLTGLKYDYTLLSTDNENHTIQYLVDWGDNSDPMSSHFFENGTTFVTNHSWEYAGVYTLRAYAIDEKDYVSKTFEQFVLIDSIFCGNIGYMIDYTGDNTFDLFHSNATGEETPVDLVDDVYLIDDDNDGNYDYQLDILTFIVSTYVEPETNEEKTTSWMNAIMPIIPYILMGIMIVVIILILFFTFKILQKSKKKKVKKKVKNEKEKKVTKKEDKKSPIEDELRVKEKPVKSMDDGVKSVEDEIDELLSKKK
jgi:PKD repeat protein